MALSENSGERGMKMKTIKLIAKNNSFIILSTFLLVISAEILTGIMWYNLHSTEFETADFYGNILFRIFSLFAGVVSACFYCCLVNNGLSGILAAITTVFTTVASVHENGYSYDKCYNICFILALLSLSFYYVNKCRDSLKHTVYYYALMAVLAAATADKNEIFMVLTVSILMFASNRELIGTKQVFLVNGIFMVAAVIVSACAVVDRMDAYIGIVYIEGSVIHPERVLLSRKSFGTAMYFNEIADAPSMYNLTKIFGYYGFVAGTVMCIVIALFVASVFIKCFSNRAWTKCAAFVAVAVISIRCFTGFFENFSIITGSYSGIPILSDGSCGYFGVGILLGALLVPLEMITYSSVNCHPTIKTLVHRINRI